MIYILLTFQSQCNMTITLGLFPLILGRKVLHVYIPCNVIFFQRLAIKSDFIEVFRDLFFPKCKCYTQKMIHHKITMHVHMSVYYTFEASTNVFCHKFIYVICKVASKMLSSDNLAVRHTCNCVVQCLEISFHLISLLLM